MRVSWDLEHVTQFDLIALLILAASCLIGFARGALRELTTVIAFVLAVAIALVSLRLTGALARHWLHPAWLGNVVALVVGFVVSYLAIRIAGAGITRGVHEVHALGWIDRIAGVGIGLFRGFVVLGVFQMAFTAATPRERMPQWISHAALYPAASASAEALKALEPSGLALVGKLAPALKQAVTDDGDDKGPPGPGDKSVERLR
jgi:membrane protein required for colicin V production